MFRIVNTSTDKYAPYALNQTDDGTVLFRYSAGKNRGTVSVEIRNLQLDKYDLYRKTHLAFPGAIQARYADSSLFIDYQKDSESKTPVVLIVHRGVPGSLHGIGLPKIENGKVQIKSVKPVWAASSVSGEGYYYAGLFVLQEPIAVKTSGYLGRRDWKIITIPVEGDPMFESLSDYLASRSPVMTF